MQGSSAGAERADPSLAVEWRSRIVQGFRASHSDLRRGVCRACAGGSLDGARRPPAKRPAHGSAGADASGQCECNDCGVDAGGRRADWLCALSGARSSTNCGAEEDRIVVRLDAAGDLDATLEVYRRVRSQLEPVNCELSDRRGQAGFQFRPVRNGIYLIPSVSGRLGGRPLPARGVRAGPAATPARPGAATQRREPDARLAARHERCVVCPDARGHHDRLNLAAGPCMSLLVYARGHATPRASRRPTAPAATAICCLRLPQEWVGDTAWW